MQAADAFSAQARAASRSSHLSTQNPPMCSFASANGPSVVVVRPSATLTTVETSGVSRPPPNTHAPAIRISSLTSATCLNIRCTTSGAGTGRPST
jgi:hypothetical protein